MEVSGFFPDWSKLTPGQQQLLIQSSAPRSVKKGTVLHNGSADCVGLFLVCRGQLRAYINSDSGREITLYRLFERDVCMFSASCMMSSIQFDIVISAEQDCDLRVIPVDTWKAVMAESAPLANFTNQLMASRFTEVMWLLEQVLFKSFDVRLAGFLLEESAIEGGQEVRLTHERIAAHLGSAREVVTRMLRYFQSEGLVSLTRGVVELTDLPGLRRLAES